MVSNFSSSPCANERGSKWKRPPWRGFQRDVNFFFWGDLKYRPNIKCVDLSDIIGNVLMGDKTYKFLSMSLKLERSWIFAGITLKGFENNGTVITYMNMSDLLCYVALFKVRQFQVTLLRFIKQIVRKMSNFVCAVIKRKKPKRFFRTKLLCFLVGLVRGDRELILPEGSYREICLHCIPS